MIDFFNANDLILYYCLCIPSGPAGAGSAPSPGTARGAPAAGAAGWRRGAGRPRRAAGARHRWRRRQRASVGKISAKCCSFSAVSAPIFARKYAFCSIFQNLPDYQSDIFEIWQNFANFATSAIFLLKFHENCCFFKPIFCENFEIAAVQKDANLVELEKCCRTHIFLQNFILIQPRTSPLKICKILLIIIFPILLILTLRVSPPRRAP